MEKKVNDNFYNYINNNWFNNMNIPLNKSSISNFSILQDKINLNIKNKILELNDCSRKNNKYSMLKIIYKQGCNLQLKNVNDEILLILNKIINSINICENSVDLFNTIIDYELQFGFQFILSFIINTDFSNSNYNILHINL